MGYLDSSTWVYGRTREGTSPVPNEQVGRLKERYPCISIMINPEPWQGKAALILAKPSVQHEHKASQLHFLLFLMEPSPLTAKPMWLWIQQCFLPFLTFDSFLLFVTKSQCYFHKHWVNILLGFVNSSVAKLQLWIPSASRLAGGGGEGQYKKF